MVVYVVQENSTQIEFSTFTAAQTYATANSLDAPFARNKIEPSLMSYNLSAGLTQEQSDMMFDMYTNILLEVKADELDAAVILLEAKSPEDFITQNIINAWIATIESHI